jgi:DUF1365 family protein
VHSRPTRYLRSRGDRLTQLSGGRVKLLCYPRLLGYTFNPLSVYFCYRAGGELALIIYEVRNTFGGLHAYVIPVKPGELNEAGLRQQRAFVTLPLVTLKIVAAIHWEALRLWLKGARLVPRPMPRPVPRLVSNPHAAAANAVNIILASGQPHDYTISASPAASSREGALVQ